MTISAEVNADGSVSVYDNKGTVGMNMAVVSAIHGLGAQSTTTPSSSNAPGSGQQGDQAQQKGIVTIDTKGAPDTFARDVIKSMVYTNHSGLDPYNDITDRGVDIHINYSHGASAPEMQMESNGLDIDNSGHVFAPLKFDPQMGLKIGNRIQSPALGLFHEAEHAWRLVSGAYKPTSRVVSNDEENFIIRGPETQAAKILGEPWRSSHVGTAEAVNDPTYHGISHD